MMAAVQNKKSFNMEKYLLLVLVLVIAVQTAFNIIQKMDDHDKDG